MTNDMSNEKTGDTKHKVYLFKNKTVPHDPYHDKFQAHGFDPVFVPLLKHELVDQNELGQYLRSSEFRSGRNAIIITSQRAIEALNLHLDELKKEEEAGEGTDAYSCLLEKPVYTVGPASESALKRWGYKDVRGGSKAGNGLRLSEIILEECSCSGKDDNEEAVFESFIFFTGVTRRDIIPQKLQSAQMDVQERVVYRTLAIDNLMDHVLTSITTDQHEKEQDQPPFYVFFSPAEADPVVEAVRKLSESKPVRLAAIGPTTESYLQEKGMTPHVVASKPDAEHLVGEILEKIRSS